MALSEEFLLNQIVIEFLNMFNLDKLLGKRPNIGPGLIWLR